jgi:hypothetical protein
MAETRKIIDCRNFPGEKPCSIAISGTEEEVLELAVSHAGSVHGHQDTPDFASSSARCSRMRAEAAPQPNAVRPSHKETDHSAKGRVSTRLFVLFASWWKTRVSWSTERQSFSICGVRCFR